MLIVGLLISGVCQDQKYDFCHDATLQVQNSLNEKKQNKKKTLFGMTGSTTFFSAMLKYQDLQINCKMRRGPFL